MEIRYTATRIYDNNLTKQERQEVKRIISGKLKARGTKENPLEVEKMLSETEFPEFSKDFAAVIQSDFH